MLIRKLEIIYNFIELNSILLLSRNTLLTYICFIMKRFILLLTSIGLTYTSYAQELDFFDFIENLDCNISVADFEEKYENIINQNIIPNSQLTDSTYSEAFESLSKTMDSIRIKNNMYNLHNLKIGGHEVVGTISLLRDTLVLLLYPTALPMFSLGIQSSSEETSAIISDINKAFEKRYYIPVPGVDTFVDSVKTEFGAYRYEMRKWEAGKYIFEVAFTEPTNFGSGNYIITVTSKDNLTNQSYEFRKSNWGDTRNKVKMTEGKENTSKNRDIYSFTDYLGGKQVDVVYFFSGEKLFSGKYFKLYSTWENDFIEDYEYFFRLLIKKYGTPAIREVNDPSDRLYKMCNGKLSLENYIMWKTESSYIVLTLSVDNEYQNTVYFGIEYTGKNYNMEDAIMDLL